MRLSERKEGSMNLIEDAQMNENDSKQLCNMDSESEDDFKEESSEKLHKKVLKYMFPSFMLRKTPDPNYIKTQTEDFITHGSPKRESEREIPIDFLQEDSIISKKVKQYLDLDSYDENIPERKEIQGDVTEPTEQKEWAGPPLIIRLRALDFLYLEICPIGRPSLLLKLNKGALQDHVLEVVPALTFEPQLQVTLGGLQIYPMGNKEVKNLNEALATHPNLLLKYGKKDEPERSFAGVGEVEKMQFSDDYVPEAVHFVKKRKKLKPSEDTISSFGSIGKTAPFYMLDKTEKQVKVKSDNDLVENSFLQSDLAPQKKPKLPHNLSPQKPLQQVSEDTVKGSYLSPTGSTTNQYIKMPTPDEIEIFNKFSSIGSQSKGIQFSSICSQSKGIQVTGKDLDEKPKKKIRITNDDVDGEDDQVPKEIPKKKIRITNDDVDDVPREITKKKIRIMPNDNDDEDNEVPKEIPKKNTKIQFADEKDEVKSFEGVLPDEESKDEMPIEEVVKARGKRGTFYVKADVDDEDDDENIDQVDVKELFKRFSMAHDMELQKDESEQSALDSQISVTKTPNKKTKFDMNKIDLEEYEKSRTSFIPTDESIDEMPVEEVVKARGKRGTFYIKADVADDDDDDDIDNVDIKSLFKRFSSHIDIEKQEHQRRISQQSDRGSREWKKNQTSFQQTALGNKLDDNEDEKDNESNSNLKIKSNDFIANRFVIKKKFVNSDSVDEENEARIIRYLGAKGASPASVIEEQEQSSRRNSKDKKRKTSTCATVPLLKSRYKPKDEVRFRSPDTLTSEQDGPKAKKLSKTQTSTPSFGKRFSPISKKTLDNPELQTLLRSSKSTKKVDGMSDDMISTMSRSHSKLESRNTTLVKLKDDESSPEGVRKVFRSFSISGDRLRSPPKLLSPVEPSPSGSSLSLTRKRPKTESSSENQVIDTKTSEPSNFTISSDSDEKFYKQRHSTQSDSFDAGSCRSSRTFTVDLPEIDNDNVSNYPKEMHYTKAGSESPEPLPQTRKHVSRSIFANPGPEGPPLPLINLPMYDPTAAENKRNSFTQPKESATLSQEFDVRKGCLLDQINFTKGKMRMAKERAKDPDEIFEVTHVTSVPSKIRAAKTYEEEMDKPANSPPIPVTDLPEANKEPTNEAIVEKENSTSSKQKESSLTSKQNISTKSSSFDKNSNSPPRKKSGSSSISSKRMSVDTEDKKLSIISPLEPSKSSVEITGVHFQNKRIGDCDLNFDINDSSLTLEDSIFTIGGERRSLDYLEILGVDAKSKKVGDYDKNLDPLHDSSLTLRSIEIDKKSFEVVSKNPRQNCMLLQMREIELTRKQKQLREKQELLTRKLELANKKKHLSVADFLYEMHKELTPINDQLKGIKLELDYIERREGKQKSDPGEDEENYEMEELKTNDRKRYSSKQYNTDDELTKVEYESRTSNFNDKIPPMIFKKQTMSEQTPSDENRIQSETSDLAEFGDYNSPVFKRKKEDTQSEIHEESSFKKRVESPPPDTRTFNQSLSILRKRSSGSYADSLSRKLRNTSPPPFIRKIEEKGEGMKERKYSHVSFSFDLGQPEGIEEKKEKKGFFQTLKSLRKNK